ncbi:Phosducin-like protein [Clonorchis sinensis]|uniref:Phosducin-like protein n=1 Tax=Clonorchis sinensis TaxID=79923 RepID=A0A3R7FR52_CLOSI|nr:Phosducin-like protein [Clonorchis sinensis]
MSLSFDDRLLGEKVNNYCSSSEDEGEDGEGDEEPSSQVLPEPGASSIPQPDFSNHPQTGPKGVLSDYKQYKALERLKEAQKEQELIEAAKKNTLTSQTHVCFNIVSSEFEVLESLDDDDEFIAMYRQNRMRELKMSLERLPVFGTVYTLTSSNFVQEIDSTDPSVTVVVHIYEPDNSACRKVNDYLETLCTEYPHVRFCRIQASNAHLSYQFSRSGVPAIVVYKRGEVIGNMLRIDRDLGNEFYASDLENFLVDHSCKHAFWLTADRSGVLWGEMAQLGQLGSIPALVLPSGGTPVRHRKGATTEQFFIVSAKCELPCFEFSPESHRNRACGGEIAQRLERERTDRKVRGSNTTSASRLPLSRLGQPGSIPALVLPSGGMAARHRKGATAERFFLRALSWRELGKCVLVGQRWLDDPFQEVRKYSYYKISVENSSTKKDQRQERYRSQRIFCRKK